MFTIRDSQLQAFRIDMRRQLTLRLADHLKTQFAAQARETEPAEMVRLADATLEVGSKYGFEQEKDLRPLAEYVFVFGPQLDRREDTPWIRETLGQEDLGPEEKLSRLDSFYMFSYRIGR